jgi:hypothetical protein
MDGEVLPYTGTARFLQSQTACSSSPVYLKNNPLQEYHAACFGMDQKHCNNFIRVLYHILEQCLRDADVMSAETRKEFSSLPKNSP